VRDGLCVCNQFAFEAVAMPCIPDKCRLLHGPYWPPALRVGDRADCLMHGTVVITSWTDGRIL
jgi:hypothetical protein